MMLQNFITEVNGRVINHDKTPGNEGQSVQLLASWCQYLGLPYQWSAPAFWWDDFDVNFTEFWDKVELLDNTEPLPGDIIIFSSELPGSDGDGHGSIFVRKIDSNSWEGLDANWGGKSVHLQSHNWAYVVGWFTPKTKAVLEAFVPTSIAEPSAYAPYDTKIIGARIVTTGKEPTPLYNLNNVSWDTLYENPVGTIPKGTEITVTAIAKHRLGGEYYIPDINKPEGYKIEDCQEYATDLPDVVGGVDTSLVQDEIQHQPGAILPPLNAPNMEDIIQLKHSVPYYHSMSDAYNHEKRIGTLVPTNYYIFKHAPNGMLSLTSIPGVSMRMWVNPADMKVEVQEVPDGPDWRDTYKEFDRPKYYIAKHGGSVMDLEEERKDLKISQGQPILICGTVVGPNGRNYAIPDVTFKTKQWYGVPLETLSVKAFTKPADEPITPQPSITYGPLRSELPVHRGPLIQPTATAPLGVKLYLKLRDFFK